MRKIIENTVLMFVASTLLTLFTHAAEPATKFSDCYEIKKKVTLENPEKVPLLNGDAIVANGQLFVVMPYEHSVFVYGLDGSFKKKLGTRGQGPGEFLMPAHLAVDSDGTVYVYDSQTRFIQVFAEDQKPRTIKLDIAASPTSIQVAQKDGKKSIIAFGPGLVGGEQMNLLEFNIQGVLENATHVEKDSLVYDVWKGVLTETGTAYIMHGLVNQVSSYDASASLLDDFRFVHPLLRFVEKDEITEKHIYSGKNRDPRKTTPHHFLAFFGYDRGYLIQNWIQKNSESKFRYTVSWIDTATKKVTQAFETDLYLVSVDGGSHYFFEFIEDESENEELNLILASPKSGLRK